MQLDGNIVAPNAIWTTGAANLLTFYRVDNLTVDGSGQIDGRGAIWWTCFKQKVGCSAVTCLLLPLLIGHKLNSEIPLICFFTEMQCPANCKYTHHISFSFGLKLVR